MQPFEGYVKVEGMEGFYSRDISCELQATQNLTTSPTMHHQHHDAIYKGHLYILTNENSASAATDFPAHLVRASRAVTIGRETATAYHYMTALKFARLFLPNSHIEYQLPLVKAVTATDISERFPYGRGLLPDYEVPLTREEVFSSTEDVILNKALEIIKRK
jgi:C-terminal processing protease CtpA/Prc